MSVIRRYSDHTICLAAFLLLIFSPGCCNPGTNPDLVAPTVVSVAPASGAASACPNTVIAVTFNVAMNPATIDSMTFTLTGPEGAAVAGVVTYDTSSDTATFTPSSALALSTPYTATVTTGATDAYGIALASNFVWSFTTSPNACVPRVISETPANGAVGVCPNSVVTATFSEAMNPATITGTTFTLQGPGTTAVAGARSSSRASTCLISSVSGRLARARRPPPRVAA